MREMRIKTLYQDETLTLQKLTIMVGTCKMVKFREILNTEELGLDVREVKEPPTWYLRWIKLNKLGI